MRYLIIEISISLALSDLEDEEEKETQWEYFCPEKRRKSETIFDPELGKEIINEEAKLLVFATGRRAWVPHQIAVKRMAKVAFNKTLSIPKDIATWEKQNHLEKLQEKLDMVTVPWHDYEVSLLASYHRINLLSTEGCGDV